MLAAVRSPAFEAAGGFDEAFRTVSVEDVEFGRSLHDRGLAVYLDAGLAAEHRHNFTALGALRNDFRKARGMAAATLDRRARGMCRPVRRGCQQYSPPPRPEGRSRPQPGSAWATRQYRRHQVARKHRQSSWR